MSTQDKNYSAKKTGSAAILFVDLVDSTGLYDSEGDHQARTFVSQYLSHLSEIIQRNTGTVVKTLGDGILTYFAEMDSAIQAAIEIHQNNITLSEHVMLSHIGIHYGDITIRNNDIFGDAVNIASRMVDIAKSGQSIISEQAAAQTGDVFKTQLRQIDHTIIKGKKQAISIYELFSLNDDQTIMYSADLINKSAPERNLKVSYKDQTFYLNQDNLSLIIGRTSDCNISLSSPLVSRHHATITYHKAKFIYTDKSTNGSYIKDNKQELFLRREQTILPDNGVISTGIETEKNSSDKLIYFSIE